MTKTYFYAAAAAAFLSACSSSDDAAEQSLNNKCTIRVSANASSNELDYPITISAFNETGSVQSQEITDAESSATLTLQKGQYTITASCGDNDFSNGYTTARPFMMAVQDVQANKNLELPLTMSYRVASISVSLSDIEEAVTAVSVTINTVYDKISTKGELSGSVSPTIQCTKGDDGQWKTGTFYVLPSTDSDTKLVITRTYANETTQNSVTTGEALEAGNVYNFSGKYDDTYAKYKIQVSLSAEGWKGTQNKDFTFDDNGGTTTTPGGTTPGESDTPSTGETLTEGTVWNGHIVALVDGNTATLLSTKEWENVTTLPTDDISAYTEGEYSGWSLPTEEQGKAIVAKYHVGGGSLADFNKVLTASNLTNIYNNYNKKDVRYLCGDGTSAYSYDNFNNIVGTNDKSREYRLRLVKVITVK